MIPCANQLIALCGGGLIALAGPPLLAAHQPESAPLSAQSSQSVAAPPPASSQPEAAPTEVMLHEALPTEVETPPAAPPAEVPRPIATLRKDTLQSEVRTLVLPQTLQAATSEARAESPRSVAKTEADRIEEPVPDDARPTIGTATHIAVASAGIDIAVQSGGYDEVTQSWRVDDSSAFHADTTVPVNDVNGTTLIYGHAANGIFGNLPNIQSGAEAVVTTSEGLQFVYVFESTSQVSPTDTSMLTVEGKPRLLLQTCSGWLDQHRTLVAFSLKEIVHP